MKRPPSTPTPSPMGERTDDADALDLNRRDFIRLSTLLTVASGSTQLQACNNTLHRDRICIARESDMAFGEMILEGIERSSDDRTLSWSDGDAARITFILQPQHIIEGAYTEDQEPNNPVPTRIGGETRLVFRPPGSAAGEVPFTLQAILEALRSWEPVVDPRARPRQGVALPAPSLPALPAVQSVGEFLGQVRRRRNASRSPSARLNGGPFGQSAPSPELGDAPWMQPAEDVTQIELPFRLLLSPSRYARFLHAAGPVTDDSDTTGLWTTRLAGLDPFGSGPSDRFPEHRTVRAIWTRDLPNNGSLGTGSLLANPFGNINGVEVSLDRADRRDIALQSSHPELTLAEGGQPVAAGAIQAERLWLSAMGGALDARGAWPLTDVPGLNAPLNLEKWLHRASLGRDHYVETSRIGSLWPFGVRASLVTVTERVIEQPNNKATLRQRAFILVSQPIRTWAPTSGEDPQWRQAPFRSVTFLDTLFECDCDGPAADQNTSFLVVEPPDEDEDEDKVVPVTARVLLEDRMGEVHPTTANFVFRTLDVINAKTLNGELGPFNRLPFDGAVVAYDASDDPAGVTYETHEVRWEGSFDDDDNVVPMMIDADIALDSLRELLPDSDVGQAPITVTLADAFLQDGLGGGNPQKVLLNIESTEPIMIDFGSDSRRSGGFLSPSFAVGGVSATYGAFGGDPKTFATTGFVPEAFFADALPRLFGILSLTAIISPNGEPPRLFSTATDELEGLLSDIDRFVALGQATLPAAFQSIADQLDDAIDRATQAVQAAASADLESLTDHLETLADQVEAINADLADLPLPTDPGLKQLQVVLTRLERTLQTAAAIVMGVNSAVQAVRNREVHLTWDAPLRDIPGLFLAEGSPLSLSVVARAGGGDTDAGVDISARIEDFTLLLFGVVEIPIDLLQFITRSGSKPDIDVILGGTQFSGVLRFVQTLMEIVPLDGFSDPPAIEVDATGLVANLSLPLPNVSVGVFSIENMSLSASIDIPFIGDAMLFRFGFSTRDNPFVITVMCIGGGGYFGMEATPRGLRLIEIALEARASLSLDFGVASGSVSMAVGIFLNLQMGEDGESGEVLLVGYVRIRGEVSVLGIISASLTLELSMSYQSAGNKIFGEAALTVEVSVLFFSASVTIRCRRQLSGDNQDPTFLDTMAPVDPADPLLGANSVDAPWAQYVNAFA